MAKGIFRTPDGWAEVDYGAHTISITRVRYEQLGYQPPFDALPLEIDYRAAQQKAPDNTKGPKAPD
jgi:hypothetical protein